MSEQEQKSHGKQVSFTIDGETFQTTDTHRTATELLALAGLDPARYDLGELRGEKPHTHRFKHDDRVNIREGARFVSIRESATVA